MFKLLTISNTKTRKGEKKGYFTGILHLLPANLSGKNVCPKASKGCKAACLNTAGHGRFDSVQNARLRRTQLYFGNRLKFEQDLKADIQKLIIRAGKLGMKPAIRINGTSDLPALAIKMAKMFPKVKFYDYSKISKIAELDLPKNYDVTFSRSESNEAEMLPLVDKGFNLAVVFKELPKTYKGYKVIDGDKTDLRFKDKKGVIVGLSAKGKAKQDNTGFVV